MNPQIPNRDDIKNPTATHGNNKQTIIKSDNKYMLISMTANPGRNDWQNGVQKFNNKFSNLKIESLADPTEYNDFYFLGLLKVL